MKLFENFVGQKSLKSKLEFYLNTYQSSKVVPHLMLVAPRGYGKTTLASEFANHLLGSDSKPKKAAIINCSTIKNVNSFFDSLIIPYSLFGDKEITIIFDECSELPHDVTMSLLTILNPNKDNKNDYNYKGSSLRFDFSKQTFLFATTEPHKVFHALMDRTRRVDFEEYSHEDLAEIMRRVLLNYKIEDGLLPLIAQDVRANARQAIAMANDVSNYMKSVKRDTFTLKDWLNIQKNLGLLPLGLSDIEYRLLKMLKERGEMRLTSIASVLNMTRDSVQRDIEIYLQKLNLIQISVAGRSLTCKGVNYVEQCSRDNNHQQATV